MVCFDWFQQSFKEMVAMCLVKDQTKRPTAEKLLKHSFFKSAKPPEHIVKKLFADLPPLWKRVKDLQVYPVNQQDLGVNFYRVPVDIVINWMQIKDAAQLALKKMPSAEQEAISQV